MIEFGYLFLGLIATTYAFWRGRRSKEKSLLHLSVAFAFLFLSTLSYSLSTAWWFYIAQPVVTFRHLELLALGFFACFVIATIMAVREMQKTPTKQAT